MQIFELHFNPKVEEGKSFETFVYEPANANEKRLGSLFMAGELTDHGSEKKKMLERLAKSVKEKYYSFSLRHQEKAFSESLKGANDFLAEEVKKENVGWLGNLNFGTFSLKDFNLIFTKTGDLKVLLIRNGEITDIGKELEKEEIDPYPLKIFFNIVSGKLLLGDTLLIASKNIYDFLENKEIISQIKRTGNFDEKKIKEIFPSKLFTKEEGAKISGLCFLVHLTKDKEKPKEISFSKGEEAFSFPKIPSISFLNNFNFSTKLNLLKNIKIKKGAFLIILLIILLLLGFLIFRDKNDDNFTFEEKKLGLENILLEKEELSEDYLKKIWEETEDINLKKEIEEKTFSLINQRDLSIFFEIKEFFPEKIINLNSILYIYNKNQSEIYVINTITGSEKIIKIENNFNLALKGKDSIFFFKEPNIIFSLNSLDEEEIKASFIPRKINFYASNLYLLDEESCNIEKFSLNNKDVDSWLKDKKLNQTCVDIAIDGSILILNKENSIDVYREGLYLKEIRFDIFPPIKKIEKIETTFTSPYIYLFEPYNKRIIIFNKEKERVDQIIFEDIKDFTISESGEILWILGKEKVYKIKIEAE